jgi:hypothetical protein
MNYRQIVKGVYVLALVVASSAATSVLLAKYGPPSKPQDNAGVVAPQRDKMISVAENAPPVVEDESQPAPEHTTHFTMKSYDVVGGAGLLTVKASAMIKDSVHKESFLWYLRIIDQNTKKTKWEHLYNDQQFN